MKKILGLGFVGLALVSAAGIVGFANAQGVDTSGARLLEFDGIAGQIEVRTTPGAQFNIEIIPGRKMTANVERDGTTLRIKGPLSTNMRSSCNNWGNASGAPGVMTINGTRYEEGDLPRIIVSGPDSMGLRIKRSLIRGRAGNVGGATIGHSSCGDFALGNVARDLEASISGSGNFRAGNIGGRSEANIAGSGTVTLGSVATDLELNVAGSGDTAIGSVGGKAEINVAGSGDVEIASVSRLTEVNIAGSGDVNLRAGRSELAVNIAGSGDVRHGGTVINPEISIVGSGDVIVARLEGSPRVSKLGSGEFRVN
jgi:Putative auto-transporter adhesin, head GIN domain